MALQLNQQTKPASGSHKGKSSQRSEFISLINNIVVFLAIAFWLRASVVEAFKIPSSSMVPTLEIGDHILVNKLSYGLRMPLMKKTLWQYATPDRGDIVVFTLPDDPATPDIDESQTNIIKRVMGLPGDSIEVRGMSVLINGQLYGEDERYARWLLGGRKDFGPVTVPAEHVLMLGDNRDYSKDSRFWNDPFLEISRIKGRAFIIYWNSFFSIKRMFNIIR